MAGEKRSECPSGTGNPDCYADEMIAYIHYDCPADTWYNYKIVTDYYLYDSNAVYEAHNYEQTGEWDEPGNVYCSQ